MEKWKDVRGFEGKYQVSDKGNVRSLIKGCHEEAQTINSNGYPYVSLALPGHRTKKCRVHRLVAEAFIDNPNGYPQVNHKDECKLNNNVANLEWCTSLYNNTYNDVHLKRKRYTHRNNYDLDRLIEQVRDVFKSVEEFKQKYNDDSIDEMIEELKQKRNGK